MATPNLNIPDSNGAQFLSVLNSTLQAIGASFAGSADPASMSPSCAIAYLIWADTTNKKLMQRNADNTAWIEIGTLNDDGTFKLNSDHVSATGAALANASIMWGTAGLFTWIVPADVYEISSSGCGAGGGGQGTYGFGGGSGECALALKLAVIPGETLTINVGAGGAGSPVSSSLADSTPGGNGGNTTITGSFGTITLQGGYGGLSTTYLPGESGGPGGQRGGFPCVAKTGSDGRIIRIGGKGADGLFGFGGQGGIYAPVLGDLGSYWNNGTGGLGWGAGGGGGGNDPAKPASGGGKGADGMVRIEYQVTA